MLFNIMSLNKLNRNGSRYVRMCISTLFFSFVFMKFLLTLPMKEDTMKLRKIEELVTFAQKALEAAPDPLPDFIVEHMEKMDQELKKYQLMIIQRWENDGDSFEYRKEVARITEQYYPVIRACFGTASGMGMDMRKLYFKRYIPSKLIKNFREMKRWVDGVCSLMNQPEHNHLSMFTPQLIALQEAVTQLIDSRTHTQTTRKNITGSKKESDEALRDCYQTLKLYLEGHLRGKEDDHRKYFDDLRLTAAAKPKEVTEIETDGADIVPQLEA